MADYRYVLISPVKNEAKQLDRTIDSVLSQTVRPLRWVIVSDASTDQTDAIIQRRAAENSIVVYVRKESGAGKRNFASKVDAIRIGHDRLADLSFDFVGNLDGDVTLERDYFETILRRLEENPRLGICGGLIYEKSNGRFQAQHIDDNSVAGAVQLFKRDCYDEIGGYVPLRFGGVDAAAEIMARMKGWGVETLREAKVLHHRRVAHADGLSLTAGFRRGRMFYSLGYHPLFEAFRCLGRLADRPYVFNAGAELVGYLVCALRRQKPALPADVVDYLRGEQMRRLRRVLSSPRVETA